MITLNKVVNNAYELTVGNWTVLFSYSTPVAAFSSGKYYRTNAFHSKTTLRHINAWLGHKGKQGAIIIEDVPQAFFEDVLSK